MANKLNLVKKTRKHTHTHTHTQEETKRKPTDPSPPVRTAHMIIIAVAWDGIKHSRNCMKNSTAVL